MTTAYETFGLRFEIPGDNPPHDFTDREPPLEGWCRSIRQGDVVFDVGARFGAYTMPALAAGARVTAYEPADEGPSALLGYAHHNGWMSRLTVRRVGLFDGVHGYPEEWARQVFGSQFPATNLGFPSALDRETRGSRVDHVKLDVEGLELGVLEGAAETLARWLPRLVVEDHEGVGPLPDDETSRYPERVESRRRIHVMLGGLGYELTEMPWDVSRVFLVAEHPEWRARRG
jgi:hypothetical protein